MSEDPALLFDGQKTLYNPLPATLRQEVKDEAEVLRRKRLDEPEFPIEVTYGHRQQIKVLGPGEHVTLAGHWATQFYEIHKNLGLCLFTGDETPDQVKAIVVDALERAAEHYNNVGANQIAEVLIGGIDEAQLARIKQTYIGWWINEAREKFIREWLEIVEDADPETLVDEIGFQKRTEQGPFSATA